MAYSVSLIDRERDYKDHKDDDEEDCETPICHDADEAIKQYSGLTNIFNKRINNKYFPPPPDRQELGRHSWTLLHTIAAYWPETPTKEQKENIIEFLNLLSKVYPCHICASDLEYQLENYPPNVETREEFIEWICNLHNRINKRLRKPTFDCSKHQQRWRRQHEDNWRDIEER